MADAAGALVQLRHELEVVGLGLLEPVRAGDGERAVDVRDRERRARRATHAPRELAERVLLADGVLEAPPSGCAPRGASGSAAAGSPTSSSSLPRLIAALTSTMLSPRAAAMARAASSSVRARAKSPRSVWTRPRLLCDRAMNAESPTAARRASPELEQPLRLLEPAARLREQPERGVRLRAARRRAASRCLSASASLPMRSASS